MTSGPNPPTARQIADLLAWARALTQAGPAADPAERAAYLAAKADLLHRITNHAEHTAERLARPATGREER
jgi:hypothetical protein